MACDVVSGAPSALVFIAAGCASGAEKSEKSKTEVAKEVGQKLAGIALEKGIKNAVFDRNRYVYHGRIKAVAEGAREGGLKI